MDFYPNWSQKVIFDIFTTPYCMYTLMETDYKTNDGHLLSPGATECLEATHDSNQDQEEQDKVTNQEKTRPMT